MWRDVLRRFIGRMNWYVSLRVIFHDINCLALLDEECYIYDLMASTIEVVPPPNDCDGSSLTFGGAFFHMPSVRTSILWNFRPTSTSM